MVKIVLLPESVVSLVAHYKVDSGVKIPPKQLSQNFATEALLTLLTKLYK